MRERASGGGIILPCPPLSLASFSLSLSLSLSSTPKRASPDGQRHFSELRDCSNLPNYAQSQPARVSLLPLVGNPPRSERVAPSSRRKLLGRGRKTLSPRGNLRVITGTRTRESLNHVHVKE